MNPAVIVIAYNRPDALRRLLDSLARASYTRRVAVPLVISIDRSEGAASAQVAAIADEFAWSHGPKQVIKHESHLGVVGHFRACGRLSEQYGSVVLLEDDLTVAPPYYDFAAQVLARYEADLRIAGVCLYGLWFNGFTHEPFQPIEDGNDVFFLKLPYTQGIAFTAAQWQAFDGWNAAVAPGPHPDLPPAFQRFGPDEWFPALAYHLASMGRFFCFPRVSLTAGWGDEGAHFAGSTSWFQTALQLRSGPFRLPNFDDALAVYDSFYELFPDRLQSTSPALGDLTCDIDLNATKQPPNLHHDLVLTTRPVRRAEAGFGLRMYPPELNVIENVSGTAISLARREDVYWDELAGIEARRRLHDYAWSRHRPSRRRSAAFMAAEALSKAREFINRRSDQ